MEQESVCLYAADPLYGRMILEAIQEEQLICGSYTYFSDLKVLCEHLLESKIALLLLEKEKERELSRLLEEQGMSEEGQKEICARMLLITEEEVVDPGQEIYKYLTRSQLRKQLQEWWREHGKKPERRKGPVPNHTGGQRITGFVTFTGTGVTKYLGMLQQRGLAAGSLIINLEVFPYVLPHDKPKKNLSDLIYYATIDRLSNADIQDYTYQMEGMDYVEPVAHYKDGYELDDKVAESLMEYLRKLPYGRILLVTDCRYRGSGRLLELCDQVEREETLNPVIQQKYETMVQMLQLEQREELRKRVAPLKQEVIYG